MAETDPVRQEDSFTPTKAGTYRTARYPGFYGGEVDSTGNMVKSTPTPNPAKNYQAPATGSSGANPKSSVKSLSDIYGTPQGAKVPEAPSGGLGGMAKSFAPSAGGYVGGLVGAEYGSSLGPGLTNGSQPPSSNWAMRAGENAGLVEGPGTYTSTLGDAATSTMPYTPEQKATIKSGVQRSNLYGAAGAGLGTAAVGLAVGQSPKEAAYSGGGAALGYYAGQTMFEGAGGTGAAIGAMLGGYMANKSENKGSSSSPSVICTELFSQGRMSLSVYSDDATHTDRHISSTTVRGYHLIAIPIVKLMRKSAAVSRFFQYGANWRAEECSHRLDMHDLGGAWSQFSWINGGNVKGKLIRILLEPFCFCVGLLAPEQDHQQLYREMI